MGLAFLSLVGISKEATSLKNRIPALRVGAHELEDTGIRERRREKMEDVRSLG